MQSQAAVLFNLQCKVWRNNIHAWCQALVSHVEHVFCRSGCKDREAGPFAVHAYGQLRSNVCQPGHVTSPCLCATSTALHAGQSTTLSALSSIGQDAWLTPIWWKKNLAAALPAMICRALSAFFVAERPRSGCSWSGVRPYVSMHDLHSSMTNFPPAA